MVVLETLTSSKEVKGWGLMIQVGVGVDEE